MNTNHESDMRQAQYVENMNVTVERVVSYLRARASAEAVPFKVTPALALAELDSWDYQPLFGVRVDIGRRELVDDAQEPKPGFLENWKQQHRVSSATGGIAAPHDAPTALANIVDAWTELRRLETSADRSGRYSGSDARVAGFRLEPDADAFDRELTYARDALENAITVSEPFACTAVETCDGCDRAAHVIARVIRARSLCDELWGTRPYKTVCENPAEAVFADALVAAVESVQDNAADRGCGVQAAKTAA